MLTWKEAPFSGMSFLEWKAGRIAQIKTDKIITISTPKRLQERSNWYKI